jgi:hypothetical protein
VSYLFTIDGANWGFPVLASPTSKNDQEQNLVLYERGGSTLPTEVYAVFWRAITTSNCIKLKIPKLGWLASGSILSQFLEGNPSLKVLEFTNTCFEEDHCRALATLQSTDLEVKFYLCVFIPQDAEYTLLTGFGTTKSSRSSTAVRWEADFFCSEREQFCEEAQIRSFTSIAGYSFSG